MVRSAHVSETEYVFLRDETAGLDGVIAIHSTALGPGAGGCRLWSYPGCEAMVEDATRLAEGMSYKNALADLPLGGAKAVLRLPDRPFDRAALFRAFGAAVARLDGRYVTAEDVGTSVEDMELVAGETRHVAGRVREAGPGGDPSPWTARGVFVSMRRAAERHLGRPLGDCTVAIQGVGHVGHALAEMLHAEGAKLIVADVNARNIARTLIATGATTAPVDSLLSAEADIFAPCALGGVLDAASIASLRARLVCGAANNQLATPEDGARLADKGVLYAPDYVVNAGGIINVAAEYFGWSAEEAVSRIEATADRLDAVLDHAVAQGLATNVAADALARDRILRIGTCRPLAA